MLEPEKLLVCEPSTEIEDAYDSGSFAKEYTPSTCPGSKLARKGAANIRSNLVAFNALVYSLARSKGCKFGSRFLDNRVALDPAAWTEDAGLLKALIFMIAWVVWRL